MIESLLESVFEKVSRQKVKCIVHSPNMQKFEEAVGDALENIYVYIYIYIYIYISCQMSLKCLVVEFLCLVFGIFCLCTTF